MNKRNREKKGHNGSADAHPPADRSVVGGQQEHQEYTSSAANKEAPNHWYSKLAAIKSEYVTMAFTAVIAIATVVYAVVSYFQWQEMKESVGTAKIANDVAQQSLIISQSPDVELVRSTLRPLVIGQKPIVDSEFKNFGRLSAQHFGVGGGIIIAKTFPPQIGGTSGSNLGDVPPDIIKPYVFAAPAPLTADQARGIVEGGLHLYLLGYLGFINPLMTVKGREVTRLVVFCSVYDPSRADRELMACEGTPELILDGKPLKRSHEIQVAP